MGSIPTIEWIAPGILGVCGRSSGHFLLASSLAFHQKDGMDASQQFFLAYPVLGILNDFSSYKPLTLNPKLRILSLARFGMLGVMQHFYHEPYHGAHSQLASLRVSTTYWCLPERLGMHLGIT